jgi:hypothetical protein
MSIKSEFLPIYADQPCSSAFRMNFSHVGTETAVECCCGRVHFCNDMRSDDDAEERELQTLIENEKSDPDKYFSYSIAVGVSYFYSMDKQVVFVCPCNYAGYLEKLFLSHQSSILNFFDVVTEQKLEQAQKARNKVSQTKAKVIKLRK